MVSDVHVRVMVTSGEKTPSQDPRLTISEPTVVIIAEHKKLVLSHLIEELQLFTSTVRRYSPRLFGPR